ncbi:MAG TPA: metal ABC transporter permease [Trueperaceae bacterium]
MTEVWTLFEFAFMQRALLAGVCIAIVAGVLGTFVVQRGLAFLGDGLAHAAFGGIALGAFVAATFGNSTLLEEPLLVAVPFTLAAALGIAWVRDRTSLSSDVAIGVFFAVSVALGVLFISIIPPERNVIDVWHLLFGSILAVGRDDLPVIVAVAGTALLVLLLLWPRLAYATFDSDLARSDGVRVRLLEYALFAIAALIVVVSAQVIGIVLMAAYLVIPAAAARLVARSLFAMTVLAVAIGVVSTVGGLVVSFLADIPSGSTIILSQALLFLLSTSLQRR